MIHRVQDLNPNLAEQLEGQNLIVFDGECVLCSRFYRFVLRYDRNHHFVFATAQSFVGQTLYGALNMPCDDFQTNLVVVDGDIFGHLDSFAVVMRKLGWPWRVLSVLRYLPEWIKTPFYGMVARNRYRFFGRYETCQLPDAVTRARFIPQGW